MAPRQSKKLARIFLESDKGKDILEAVLEVAAKPEYNCKQEVEKLISNEYAKNFRSSKNIA